MKMGLLVLGLLVSTMLNASGENPAYGKPGKTKGPSVVATRGYFFLTLVAAVWVSTGVYLVKNNKTKDKLTKSHKGIRGTFYVNQDQSN